MKTQTIEDSISSGIFGGCLKIILFILGLAILVFFFSILSGCQKDISRSDKPTIFIINEMSQSTCEKKLEVARYRIREITTNGTSRNWDHQWYTLKEGFQVGDTLDFVKK